MNQGSTRFFLRQKYRGIYQIWDTVYQNYRPANQDKSISAKKGIIGKSEWWIEEVGV